MANPFRHEFKAGRLRQEDAEALNALLDMLRSPDRITADFPLGFWNDAGGKTFLTCDISGITAMQPWPYWGKIISQSGTAYGWVQQDPAAAGTWVDTPGGISGTPAANPMYEENANVDVPLNTVHRIWRGFLHADTGSQEWLFEYCCTTGPVPTPCCLDQTPALWSVDTSDVGPAMTSGAEVILPGILGLSDLGTCTWADAEVGARSILHIGVGTITATFYADAVTFSVYRGFFDGNCCEVQTLYLFAHQGLTAAQVTALPPSILAASDCACPPYLDAFSIYGDLPTVTPVTMAVDSSAFTQTYFKGTGTYTVILNGQDAEWWSNQFGFPYVVGVQVTVSWASLGVLQVFFFAEGTNAGSATYHATVSSDICTPFTASRTAVTGVLTTGNTPATLLVTPNCCGYAPTSGPVCDVSHAPLGAAVGTPTATLGPITVAAGAKLVVLIGTPATSGITTAPVFAGVAMTPLGAVEVGAAESVSLWHLTAAATTTGNVGATSSDGVSPIALIGREVMGLPNNAADQTTGNTGTNSAPDVGPTITTNHACEYATAGAMMVAAGAGGAWANGFTSGQSVSFTAAAVAYTLSEGYAFLTTTGTPEAQFNGSSPQPTTWAAVLGTFS